MSITSDQKSQVIDLIRRKYPEWDSFEHRPFLRDEINTRRLTVKKATALLSESTLAHMLVTRETEAFIDRLERLGKATNLLERPGTEHGDLEILYVPTLDKPVFCAQIYHLLHGTESAQERLGAYLRYVEDHELPNSWTFPTYLLSFSNPRSDFFVEPQPTEWFLKYIGLSPYLGKPSPETYVAVKEFAHGLKHALAEYRPHDMIDIQSLIRVCASMSQPASRPAPVLAVNEPPASEPVDSWAEQDTEDADATVLHPSNPLAQAAAARPAEPQPTIPNGSRPTTPLDQYYRTFLETFMTSQNGIGMAAAFARSREQAEQHFAHIVAEHELGEIVTERVFLHLLPHADRREHVASGAWIHPMPALDDALNGLARLSSIEREQAAIALLELTRQCVYNSRAIGSYIERFKHHTQAAPFQSRHMSPMLHALKPGSFLLASEDTVATINFFSGTGYTGLIEQYPDVNEAGLALVRYLHSGANAFGVKSVQNTDLFAIFCSWFIANHGPRKQNLKKPIDLPTVDTPLSGDGGPTRQEPPAEPLARHGSRDLTDPMAPLPVAEPEPPAPEPLDEAEIIVEIDSPAEEAWTASVEPAAEEPAASAAEWTPPELHPTAVAWTSRSELIENGASAPVSAPEEADPSDVVEPEPIARTPEADPTREHPVDSTWTDELLEEAAAIDEQAPPPLTESDAEALAAEALAIDRLLEENAAYQETGDEDDFDAGYDTSYAASQTSDFASEFDPGQDTIPDDSGFGDAASAGVDDIPEVLRSMDTASLSIDIESLDEKAISDETDTFIADEDGVTSDPMPEATLPSEPLPNDTPEPDAEDDVVAESITETEATFETEAPAATEAETASDEPIYLPHTYLSDSDEFETADESGDKDSETAIEAEVEVEVEAVIETEIDPKNGTGTAPTTEPAIAPVETERYDLTAPTTVPDLLEECAEMTGYSVTELRRWIDTIRRKRQVIISGPPGAGKTFLARHLARILSESGDGFVETVQFHPSYGYEDFVGPLSGPGYEDARPASGRFPIFCERAARRSGDCVMVIDEINRADLSRVFGELVYLLEYREDTISLASGASLRVPENVLLIGTMSASAGPTIDPIVRRRFAFIELPPRLDVLERYLTRVGYPAGPLIALLERLNAEIVDPNRKLGIASFMREDLADHLEAIWRMEVEPALETSFYGRPEKLAAYRWELVSANL